MKHPITSSERCGQLVQAMLLLRTNYARLFAPLLRQEGLTFCQLILLYGVGVGQIDTISSAARILNMGQGNISTLCKRMENAGFLCRQRQREDERVVILTLTPRSQDILAQVEATLDRLWDRVEQNAPELCRSLLTILQQIDEIPQLIAKFAEEENITLTKGAKK